MELISNNYVVKFHGTAENLPAHLARRAVRDGADAAVGDGDHRAAGARRRKLRELRQRIHSRNAPLHVIKQNEIYSQIHLSVCHSILLLMRHRLLHTRHFGEGKGRSIPI